MSLRRFIVGQAPPDERPDDRGKPFDDKHAAPADGAHEVGTLTSVARTPGSGVRVALATLHRRVTPPETVEIRWESDGAPVQVTGEARPLPLDATA